MMSCSSLASWQALSRLLWKVCPHSHIPFKWRSKCWNTSLPQSSPSTTWHDSIARLRGENMSSASSASSISSLPLHLIWRSSSPERAICFCFAPSGSFACFACSACSVFSMKVISFWNRYAGVSTRFWSISSLSSSWSPASAH